MKQGTIVKDVCVVGGGPAGMFLGLLLAKQGLDVVVTESHDSFAREYRGEVLQPRFIQLLNQLNLREYIESFPHAKLEAGTIYNGDKKIGAFDFSDYAAEVRYALWMPQPVLLQALYEKAQMFPSFELKFHSPVKQLLRENGRVTGVTVSDHGEPLDIRAKVTVGADGRFSTVQRLGGFEHEVDHYAGDLIWFTIPRPPQWNRDFRIKLGEGYSYLVLPKQPDHVQIGVAMPVGDWKMVQEHGIEAFRQELIAAHEAFRTFAAGLSDFSAFTPLQAREFIVREWALDGCVLIGDAAHCSSPAGALGVSLAVTTAVVAADVILRAVRRGDTSQAALGELQQRRIDEIRRIHSLQERMGAMMFTASPFIKSLRPHLVSLASKTHVLQYMQKKLLVLAEPVPIDPSFAF